MLNEYPPSNKSWIERLSDALLREPQTREQILILLRDCEERELIDKNTLYMIEAVLRFSELQVRDVMLPRAKMVVFEEEDTVAEVIPTILEAGHSRFPVIASNREEIIGILHAKELLKFAGEQESATTKVKGLVRPAVFTPESKRLDVLLQEIRLNRNHMVIVVDEYGGVSGLITMEDMIEQIVGDIRDEYDTNTQESLIKFVDKQQVYHVNALTPIAQFNATFKVDYSDEDFDTIGGLVMHQFGHFPKVQETTYIAPFQFKVLKLEARRIALLEVCYADEPTEK